MGLLDFETSFNLNQSLKPSSEEEVPTLHIQLSWPKSSFGFVPKSWQTQMNFLANSIFLRLMKLLA